MLTHEHWLNVERLYHEALQRAPASRGAFLGQVCGLDSELLADVRSLLEADADQSRFLEESVLQGAARQLAFRQSAIVGQRIGRYEVLELLGAGGMGEVYRARDPMLERDVALKLLPRAQPAARTSTPQLLREAQCAARLSHPNICTVHEVGSCDGCPFLAMEYIEGQTLAQVLKGGPLAVDRVLDYGIQIARALGHAHDRHILHRDLKSSNVLVTSDQRIKVVDFGIAKRIDPSAVAQATPNPSASSRMLVGTPAYMSPEVLRGDAADVRSEVWALGVVLYEMASGEHPFRGNTPFEVVAAIMCGPARAVATRIPPELRAILQRCLAIDPAERYQEVATLCADLEGVCTAARSSPPLVFRYAIGDYGRAKLRASAPLWGLAAAACLLTGASGIWWAAGRADHTVPAADTKSAPIRLAILPFRVDGPDDGRLLQLGLADSLITGLAGVRALQLRPMAAMRRFERAHPNATEVGRVLDVDYLLFGSVKPRGDSYRINLELVRADDGFVIWTDAITGPRTRLLQLEELILDRVTRGLNVEMTEEARSSLARGDTTNPQAHLQYLAGRSLVFRPGHLDLAVQAFEDAVRLDPGYARAHAALAHVLARKYWEPQSTAAAAEYRGRAMRAAEHALGLDPQLATAHEALSTIYRYTEAEWDKAIDEARKALELDPTLELPHHNMASAFYHLGLSELSDQESVAGVQANPESRLHAQLTRARSALYDGRFSVAQQLITEVNAAGDAGAAWVLAEIRFFLRDVEWSQRTLERIAHGSPGVHGERARASLASVLAFRGHHAAAETWLRPLVARPVTDHHVSYRIATAYAQLGKSREAVNWLRWTIDTGFPCYPWFMKDKLLDPVRGDSAFAALMEDQRAEWEVRRARYAPVRRAF